MKTNFLLLTLALSLIIIPFLLSEPGFNGPSPGCDGSGCHTFQDGDVAVTNISGLAIQVTVTGNSSGSKVAGELVDVSGVVVDVVNPTSSNPFTLNAPTPGVYRINAGFKNPSRRWDSTMVDLNVVTPPNAPSNLVASTVSNSEIDISWSDNSTDEDGFKIERRLGQTGTWNEIAQTGPNVTSFNNTGLPASTEYCYRVRAFNAGGNSGYSNIDCATTNPNVPNAPSNLIAIVNQNPLSVELNWTDNSDNEDGFVIERDSPVANFVVIDTVGQNVTTFVDTTVTITTYIYRVKAFNISGDSPYSDTAQVFVPVELTSFTANAQQNGVMLKWVTATETNNMGFEVQRKVSNDWQKLTFVDGKGNTTKLSHYQYFDNFKDESFTGKLSYRLKQIDFDGTFEYSDVVNIDVDFTPDKYSLAQNYPNPFNPSTKIKYEIPQTSLVVLKVYDVIGNEVATLVNKEQAAGKYQVNFDAKNFSSGIYYYQIKVFTPANVENFIQTKKMILLR